MIYAVGREIRDYIPECADDIKEYNELMNTYGFKDTRDEWTRFLNSIELISPEDFEEIEEMGGNAYEY